MGDTTPSFADFVQQKPQKAAVSKSPSFADFVKTRTNAKAETAGIPLEPRPSDIQQTPKPTPESDEEKLKKPLKPWEKLSFGEKADFTVTHSWGIAETALSAVSAATEQFFQKNLKTEEEKYNARQQNLMKIVNDPKSLPHEKETAEKMLHYLQTSPWQQLKRKYDPTPYLQGAGKSFVDWEVMGALFKPLEFFGAMAGNSAKARTAVYAVNQAIGAKFSYDQAKSGLEHWSKGEYGQAITDFGGSAALLFMPMLHAMVTQRDITVQQAKQKAIADLEAIKQQQAGKENNPFSNEQITQAQEALRGNNPFDIMARSAGPAGERVALRTQEGMLKDKLRRENVESERQRTQAAREADFQEQQHNLRLKAEQAKTDAEKTQFESELDERLNAHKEEIAREKARFQPQTKGATREWPPIPEKRPFQEPATIVRGRQPLTREEREQERFDERERQVRDELAAEKQRRFEVAQKALRQGLDVEERQLSDIERQRERDLRAGIGFRVVDNRGIEAPPGAGPPSGPSTAAAAPEIRPDQPLEPPPANVRELEKHEAAASWSIMEYERRKNLTSDPAELAEIDREIEENKKLLADVTADRKAAEALMAERKAPKTRTAGDLIAGIDGSEATLKTVTHDYPVRYKVVEGGDLKTSHHHETFEPVAGYPEGVQERDYKNDKDAQVAVIQHAQNYDPAFTISDAPGPEHGPPIITPDGIVLGGNSRVMSTMRLDEEANAGYRAALMAKASQFGLDPAAIAKMKNPVLVREVTNPPENINDLRAMGSDLNRVFTRKLSEYEQAVSAGKRISQETLDYVGAQLADMGEGASLRDLLRDQSKVILEKLESDGIIAANERRAFVDEKTGALNETGKDFVERALLGAVVDDPLILANAPKGVLRKVERALAPLARIKARGEPWDITDYLKEALREHIIAASKGVGIEEHYNPPNANMFPPEPVHPITKALAEKLDETSLAVKKAFEDYAADSDRDLKGQESLGFYQPPVPWDSFNASFEAKVRPDEWGTLLPKTAAAEPMEAPPSKAIEPPPEPAEPPPARAEQKQGTIEVAPELLKYEGKIERTYSADTIGLKGTISGIFQHGGKNYVSVGSSGRGGVESIKAMEVVAPKDYSGKTYSYGEKTKLPESERHPFYEGMKVKYRGKDFVLTNETNFVPQGGTKAIEPPPSAVPSGTPPEEIEAAKKAGLDIEDVPPQTAREIFAIELKAAFPDVKPEQLEATMALIDARAKAVGQTTDEWLKKKNLSAESAEESKKNKTTVLKKGKDFVIRTRRDNADVTFSENGIIIRAFQKDHPNIAAIVHELGHIFRRDLKAEELLEAEKAFGIRDHDWNRDAEEKFARSFEKYLTEGKAPTEGLRGIFEKLKAWLSGIYNTLKAEGKKYPDTPGTPLDVKISPEVQKLFEQMLGGTEPIEAPPTPEEPPKPTAPEPAKKESTFGRTLNIFRGAHGSVRVEFPDKNHADLFSLPGRARRESWDKPTIASDAKGLAARLGVPETQVFGMAYKYRDYVMDAVKDLKEGETFKAETHKDAQYKVEPPPTSERLEPKDVAKGMSDEELRKAVADLEKKRNAPFLRRENKQRMAEYAKPFEEELARRGGAGKTEDRAVIYTKDAADAAIERLKKRKPPITLSYTEDEEQTISDMATLMGHLFENGHTDFDSNYGEVKRMIGDWTKPFAQVSWNKMLSNGKVESEKRLGHVMSDADRRKYSNQLALFETHEKKNRSIELPPGTEVRREEREAPKPKPVNVREKTDVNAQPQGRTPIGQTPGRTDQPVGREPLGTPGRGVRPARESGRVPGVTEQAARPLRHVEPPEIDVPFIPSESPVVQPEAWVAELRASNLPDKLPPPTVSLSPEIAEKLIYRGQPEIVQTALTSLQKYKSFILASTTGTGKTYTGSAIIAERKPQYGLILTPSAPMTANWINVAREFGIEIKPLPKNGPPTEPGVYVGSYPTAINRLSTFEETKVGDKVKKTYTGIKNFDWDLVMADESHKARRWHSETGIGVFLKDLSPRANEIVYTSATPFHSALELGYMDKLGLWKNQGLQRWLRREFNTYKSEETGNWISPFNPRKLAALREELIRRGMMVNLDRDMRGYDVNFAVSPLGMEHKEAVRNTIKGFRLAEDYFKRLPGAGNMIMAVRGNAKTFMKSYLERLRLPEAIELGKKLEREGWKVAYFTETKKEVPEVYDFLKPADQYFRGEISRLLPKLPSVVDTLKEAFGDDIANFTGPHGVGRQEELDAFNRNDTKHIIATYGAGGLGISMHDMGGNHPRAAIYLGPPWSGVMFDQAIGRPWRFGAKSNVAAYILTSNAAPEMELLFKKVLPRFESLKASISGIHKNDPIVDSMKDLDAALSYEFGEKDGVSTDEFMKTIDTNAVTSIKETKIPSAEGAKNKGMQVERRTPIKPPNTLSYTEDVPEDLPGPHPEDEYAEAARTVRRPFVPSGTKVSDPRLLDWLDNINRSYMGVKPDEPAATAPAGAGKPPDPPEDVVGRAMVPPPGDSSKRDPLYDLGNPAITRKIYEWQQERFGGRGLPQSVLMGLAKFEQGVRVQFAQLHTAPFVLKDFKETEMIPRETAAVEMHARQKTANYRYEFSKLMGDFAKDPIADRRIFEALQRAHDPLKELRGTSSEWVDHQPFTDEELKVAQKIRDEILEPIIDSVQAVRPDVGKRLRYAPLVRQIDELLRTLYPDLLGNTIPSDLYMDFSAELRGAMPTSKDPFSPHILERKSTPPKALRMSEVMDGYIPSMVRVAEYTPLARRMSVVLAGLPKHPFFSGRDAMLTEFAKKYVRHVFGIDEYAGLNHALAEFTRPITKMAYSAALDWNPSWLVLHSLKVPFNVWPEIGSKYAALGYKHMMSPDGWELVNRSGVLIDVMWRLNRPQTKVGGAWSKFLHGPAQLSDVLDRGVAYLGGLEKAKDLGFLGDSEKVGKITWKRLTELSAEGVDVQKAMDYAYSAVARSNFMYTPSNVQFFVKENPMMGMYKSYIVRQTEFLQSTRRLAKEAKAQSMEPEEFALMKAAKGEYEYIDAVAKYRRLVGTLAIGAATAIGFTAFGITQRVWPYHLATLLSSPLVFASDTLNLINKTLNGEAKESEWISWMKHGTRTFSPIGRIAFPRKEKGSKHRKYEFEPLPKNKYEFEPLPR